MSEQLKTINDTTFREGQQAANLKTPEYGVIFRRGEMIKIAELLTLFGIEYIELPAPVNSPYALETNLQIRETVLSLSNKTEIAVHSRCTLEDIDAAVACMPHWINLYIGASEQNRNGNGQRTLETTIKKAETAVDYLYGKGINIRFSPEDAQACNDKELLKIIERVAFKIRRLGLPDTTGHADPKKIYDLIRTIKKTYPHLEIQFHGHNDDGKVTERYESAFAAGADVFDTTILGIGERNGIQSLSNQVELLSNNNVDIRRYNIGLLNVMNSYIERLFGKGFFDNTPNSPSLRTHSSGVHVNAISNDPESYERGNHNGTERKIIFYSSVVGAANILILAQKEGLSISKEIARQIASEVREYAREFGYEGLREFTLNKIFKLNQNPNFNFTV